MPRQLDYADEDCTFSASVRRATLGDELRRLEMMNDAIRDNGDSIAGGFAINILPSLLCVTGSGELTYNGEAVTWPPALNDVLERLPRAALDEWIGVVYDLNPDWKPQPVAADEAEEKKIASRRSTKRQKK
ncbi:MAG TPA: hypothetical protein VLH56_08960 [Dissulfurispiraceae bacterium]|nr:hypothetical protein [Dissulfurispiraceae bacterium]